MGLVLYVEFVFGLLRPKSKPNRFQTYFEIQNQTGTMTENQAKPIFSACFLGWFGFVGFYFASDDHMGIFKG